MKLQQPSTIGQLAGKSAFYRLSVVVLLLVFFVSAHGQAKHDKAVILKTGETIFGKVTLIDSVQKLSVENNCGIRIISFGELDTIVDWRKKSFTDYKKHGYFNISSVSLLLGEGQSDRIPVPSFTVVNGYYFHPRVYTGIGIGYEYYQWSVMPLFADVKYLLRRHDIIPFASLKLGYGIPLESAEDLSDYYPFDDARTYGGVMISPELGLLFPRGQRDAILLSVGYHHQQLSYDSYQYWFQDFNKRRTFTNYNRISIRFSYMFR